VKKKIYSQVNEKEVEAGEGRQAALIEYAKQTSALEMQAGAQSVCSSIRVCSLNALQVETHSLRMQANDTHTNPIDLIHYRKKETE
jgi:hypothetical protein